MYNHPLRGITLFNFHNISANLKENMVSLCLYTLVYTNFMVKMPVFGLFLAYIRQKGRFLTVLVKYGIVYSVMLVHSHFNIHLVWIKPILTSQLGNRSATAKNYS